MPRRLGQHFLADRGLQRRMVDALHLDSSQLVVEIGAGRGALTHLLAERAGAVAAIELDPALAEFLRQEFAGEPRVRVIQADILQAPLAELVRDSGYGKARVAGNLPYYITSPILMRLFETAQLWQDLTVMVQREVAERLVARPGGRDYSLLSVTAQYYARPVLLFRIAPGAFRPPPEVESAVVQMPIAPRGGELGIVDDRGFLRFVRACFQQRRKMLTNNLKSISAPDRVRRALEALGLAPAARAETLSLEQFAALYKSLTAGR